MRLLYDLNGYRINWAAVSTDAWLVAMEESVFDTEALKIILGICLAKEELNS